MNRLAILFVFLAVVTACTSKTPTAKANVVSTNDKTEKSHAYTEDELIALMDSMNTRMEAIAGTPLMRNFSSSYTDKNGIVVWLKVNTEQWRSEFRRRVSESPAIIFRGPEVPEADSHTAESEAYGVTLSPKLSVYSVEATDIKFVIRNGSNQPVTFGKKYFMTFKDSAGTWRRMPGDDAFFDIAYELASGEQKECGARLYPELMELKPGTYRYFKSVSVGNHNDVLLMAEFQLSDDLAAVKSAKPVTVAKKAQLCEVEERVFDAVEEMPQYSGGLAVLSKLQKQPCPSGENAARVIVKFIIEKDGSVSHSEIVRSSGSGRLDAKALDVVAKMDRWTPGRQNGQLVRVNYTLPVSFR